MRGVTGKFELLLTLALNRCEIWIWRPMVVVDIFVVY